MTESSPPERVDRAGQALTPEKSPEVLAVYGRLLALYNEHLRRDEFNPYQSIPFMLLKSLNPAFHIRMWRNLCRQAAPFWNTSNTLPQGLVGGTPYFGGSKRSTITSCVELLNVAESIFAACFAGVCSAGFRRRLASSPS